MTAAKTASPEPIPVTVTFLEMAVPPPHYPPLPHNRPVALLKVRNIPLHFYRYLMDRVGRKWHWVNALRLSDAELSTRLNDGTRDIRVLHVDGAPAGFFEISARPPQTGEIVYFGLTDTAMGQGIGRWFLGAAIEAAWASRPERVTVQTCTLDHPAALPLYQKMGFSPVAQQQETVHPMTLDERAAVLARP